MTKEEAIQQLQNCKDLIKQDGQDYLDERDAPILDVAIEALQTDIVRCADCKHWYEWKKGVGSCHRSENGHNWFGTDASDYCSFGERIELLPFADVALVVRCKDCTHNNDCDIQYSAQAGDNFFCGFGEIEEDVRKDGRI